jgi:formyltetrahydrofolate-dependent phosphoribosylglycinamide formyltransferase
MLNVAIFASGRGSNFLRIQECISEGKIQAKICCLITDNAEAGAIEYAKKFGMEVYVVHPKNYKKSEFFGHKLLEILDILKIDWIILAGYLKKIPENVVIKFANRILNIHPALLPAFGGKGMYGMHVHRAVLDSGAKISGVTVHLVNNEYDKGPVVMQRAVDIENCETAQEIASAVLKVEHQLYSEAVQRLFSLSFTVVGNRVVFK